MSSLPCVKKMNSKDSPCIVCGMPLIKTIVDERWNVEMEREYLDCEKHHVNYFPEVIAYVHQKCHAKIHDPDNPIIWLIEYAEGDSRKFYKLQKESQLKAQAINKSKLRTEVIE